MPKLMPYDRTLPYSYAPGVFPSLECMRLRGDCARRLLLHSAADRNEGVDKLRDACASRGVRIEEADRLLARLSHKENCYAALVFDKFECALAADRPHIVLHHPSDGGNLGTILRTCAGFGFTQIALIRPAVDAFDPHVVRASMGALFAMQLCYFDAMEDYRAAFPAHRLYPFMLDGAVPLDAAAVPQSAPYALVFGNEAAGLPASFAAMGQAVRIPHSAQIDSLNLSVAAAIGMYAFAQANSSHVERRFS